MIIKFCGEVGQKIVVNEFFKNINTVDDYLMLDIVNEKEIEVSSRVFYSDDEPCVNYSSLLKISETEIKCDNSNIRIIKYPNNHYKIFVKKLYIEINNSQNIIFNTKINDCDVSLINSYPQSLKIVRNNKKCVILLKKHIKNPVFCEFCNNIMLNGTTKDNLEYCLLFNNGGEILLECYADKIEVGENIITTLQKLNDVSNHGYVCVYKLTKNEVVLEKSYTVYLDNNATFPANDYAIIWAYVEALNVGNLKLARSFLSEELNTILKDEDILTYFGNYSEMDTNWITDNQNIIWVIKDGNNAEGYIFEVTDQKIQNIDQI